ncbi:MAG: hypothetical protein MZU95_05890 [Desulfomicrobium escambiense]|nr:hypothetical protein [Desulfomicrobium escambiense]
MFSALAIAVHNFPEGLATFAVALAGTEVPGCDSRWPSRSTTCPEGWQPSAPRSTAPPGSRTKGFPLVFPVGSFRADLGALIGFFFLRSLFSGGVTRLDACRGRGDHGLRQPRRAPSNRGGARRAPPLHHRPQWPAWR